MTNSRKWISGIACLVLLGVGAAIFAAEAAKPRPAGHAGAAKAIVWSADQLKWVDNTAAPAGVKMAVLWGDPTKGAHGALHKFPAGFKAGLHTHSADLHNLVVSGTLIHGTEDGKETRLGPGSYIFEPHTYKHTTACDAASECVILVSADGKFDVNMVEKKK